MLAGSSDLIGDSEASIGVMGRMGTPEEIVYGMVFLVSDESSYMTGTELVIDGGELSGQWRSAETPSTVCGDDWAGVMRGGRTERTQIGCRTSDGTPGDLNFHWRPKLLSDSSDGTPTQSNIG